MLVGDRLAAAVAGRCRLQPEHLHECGKAAIALADPCDLCRERAPIGGETCIGGIERAEEGSVATALVLAPREARQDAGDQHAVWLTGGADRGQQPAPGDVGQREALERGARGFGQQRGDEVARVGAKRRRPKRAVHRQRFGDVHALGARQRLDAVETQPERLGEALHVALVRMIEGRHRDRLVKRLAHRLDAGGERGGESGLGVLVVVGGRAGRNQIEAGGEAMRRDQPRDARGGVVGIAGQPQPERDHAVEAAARPRHLERNAQRQADLDRGVEVEQPAQLGVGDEPAGGAVAIQLRLELLRIGSDDQIVGDRLAEDLMDHGPAGDGDDCEAIGHHEGARHAAGAFRRRFADIGKDERLGQRPRLGIPIGRPLPSHEIGGAALGVAMDQRRPRAFLGQPSRRSRRRAVPRRRGGARSRAPRRLRRSSARPRVR